LNVGLGFCTDPIIARLDADDLCYLIGSLIAGKWDRAGWA